VVFENIFLFLEAGMRRANMGGQTFRYTFEKMEWMTARWLCPNNGRPGQFYLLPIIKKIDMPDRPIVSAIEHPTEEISEFIDLHLRQHLEDLPSYLKDTTYHLNKTPSSGQPDHTLLVTMDVILLNTNIPRAEGIEACKEVSNSRAN
jgi:hypothetical protein